MNTPDSQIYDSTFQCIYKSMNILILMNYLSIYASIIRFKNLQVYTTKYLLILSFIDIGIIHLWILKDSHNFIILEFKMI